MVSLHVSKRFLRLVSGALATLLLLAAPAARATIDVSWVGAGWVVDLLEPDPYWMEMTIGGTGIASASVQTPSAATYNFIDGELDVPFASKEALEAAFPTGVYSFDLTGTASDALSFDLDLTRPTEPTGFPTITSPDDGDTTGTNPTYSWTCAGCAGGGLRAAVWDIVTDVDVYSDEFSVGGGSWTPGPLAPGDYGFGVEMFNGSFDQEVSVDPGALGGGDDFTIWLAESYGHAHEVEFTAVPEPGTGTLAGMALLGLAAHRRRWGRLRRPGSPRCAHAG